MAREIKIGDWIYACRSQRRGIVIEILPHEYVVDFKISGINPAFDQLKIDNCLKEVAKRICPHCKELKCPSIEE